MFARGAPLRLSAMLEQAMVAHAVADAPREACGLLLGLDRDVHHVVPARNVDPSPTRYTVAPEDHFAAIRTARCLGLVVLGAYHSHPAGAPRPSPSDVAEAASDFAYVIVGLSPSPAVTAWCLDDGNFVPLSLVRT